MSVRVITGDCREVLRTLPDESVHCVVTSPPYFGLRDYGVEGQMGAEASASEFVAAMVAVFRDVRHVLRSDGTLWLNIGDSYNNRTKVRTTSHQPALNGFADDNWSERAARGGVRMSVSDGDLKEKDMFGIPWLLAFALRADGWWLRQDIIWSKPNPMPESVTDRCTKSHEYIFLLSKSDRYHFDQGAIAEPAAEATVSRLAQDIEAQEGSRRAHAGGKTNGTMKAVGKRIKMDGHIDRRKDGFNQRWDAQAEPRITRNKRSVWEVGTAPFKDAHFATFPPALIEPCILAGCPAGGWVLDPFGGAGTTGLVADRLKRNAILIELNPAYADMARGRITGDAPLLAQVAAS